MPVDSDPDRAYQIRRLLRLGMSVEAATDAVDSDRVTLALVDHLVGGPREYTRAEAAARAGLPQVTAAAVERALGVTDGTGYSEAEIRHLSLLGRLLQLVPEDRLVDQLRGDVPVLRTVALRTLDTAEDVFLRTAREEVEDEVELGVRLAEIARPLLDVSTDLIGQAYRRIVLQLLTTDMIAQALRGDDVTVELAVGFVDVVGYTSLSARIDPTGLGDVLSAFERACQDMAEAYDEIQLVKFLGDASMFVSLDPAAMAHGMFQLVQHIEDDDQVLGYAPIKGGMAAGPALLRGGDYYGSAVNEAARLTDLARRNTVLVSEDLRALLEPAFRLRRIRPVRLHGIGMRRPYALREPRPPA